MEVERERVERFLLTNKPRSHCHRMGIDEITIWVQERKDRICGARHASHTSAVTILSNSQVCTNTTSSRVRSPKPSSRGISAMSFTGFFSSPSSPRPPPSLVLLHLSVSHIPAPPASCQLFPPTNSRSTTHLKQKNHPKATHKNNIPCRQQLKRLDALRPRLLLQRRHNRPQRRDNYRHVHREPKHHRRCLAVSSRVTVREPSHSPIDDPSKNIALSSQSWSFATSPSSTTPIIACSRAWPPC